MACQHDKNLNNFEISLSDKLIRKVQTYRQHTIDNMMVYITKGNYLVNFVYGKPEMH